MHNLKYDRLEPVKDGDLTTHLEATGHMNDGTIISIRFPVQSALDALGLPEQAEPEPEKEEGANVPDSTAQ